MNLIKILNVSKQVHKIPHFDYCHDIMLTENYYIVHQTPFYGLDPSYIPDLMSGKTSPGKIMKYNPKLPSRFVLISRKDPKNVRFFDTEPCMIYHHLNAVEENPNLITFASVCLDENFELDFKKSNKMFLSNADLSPGTVFHFKMDLNSNKLSRQKVDGCSCEFPTIHPDLHGKQWRYAYLMASEEGKPCIPYQEIVKFDKICKNRQVWSARSEFGLVGEPVFIPDPEGKEEDDGWVIAQLYLCKQHKTQYIVLDAKNISAGPVARIKLNHFTPYGFHGTFAPELF